jgi:hypothetical protein
VAEAEFSDWGSGHVTLEKAFRQSIAADPQIRIVGFGIPDPETGHQNCLIYGKFLPPGYNGQIEIFREKHGGWNFRKEADV